MTGRLLAAAAALLFVGAASGVAEARIYCHRAYPGGPLIDDWGRVCDRVRPPTLVEPTIIERTVIDPVILEQAPTYPGDPFSPPYYQRYHDRYAPQVIVVVPRLARPHHRHDQQTVVIRQQGQTIIVPRAGAAAGIYSRR
jgi:hypothetical protein